MIDHLNTMTLNRASEFDENIFTFSLDNSPEEIETLIRAIYRQVLGNVYVMESERLTVAESQLKNGDFTVQEFVRTLAQSELYRNLFFHNCSPFRFIELNFKHLLGRAPESYEEVQKHGQILAEEGFEAEINSYIDNPEYFQAFGLNTVPYCRGNKSQIGKNNLSFTNLLALEQGAGGSDSSTSFRNSSILMQSLIKNIPNRSALRNINLPVTDVQALLAKVLKPKVPSVNYFAVARQQAYQDLQQKCQEQRKRIDSLQKRLAQLQSIASIGEKVLGTWPTSETSSPSQKITYDDYEVSSDLDNSYEDLWKQSEDNLKVIATLEAKIANSERLALFGERKLNKWRSRIFSS